MFQSTMNHHQGLSDIGFLMMIPCGSSDYQSAA